MQYTLCWFGLLSALQPLFSQGGLKPTPPVIRMEGPP